MYERTVEKSTFWQTEVGDSFTMFEPFDIRPVLLGCARLHVGQRGKSHLTVEHFREYLVEVGLLTTNDGAIREGDADWRYLDVGSWNVSECGAAVE
jgi:hypothetical protein